MTADDVVLLSMFGTEGPAVRMAAVQVASRLDAAAAEPAWRDALDRRELRCYAKMALVKRLAERDEEQRAPAELEGTTEDLAWFIADSFAPLAGIVGRNNMIPLDTAELSNADLDVSNESLFEAMARLDHSDAEAVLTMLGKHCDNKKIAGGCSDLGLPGRR
jgi:hypothetical protein